jgi:hypothetical protein
VHRRADPARVSRILARVDNGNPPAISSVQGSSRLQGNHIEGHIVYFYTFMRTASVTNAFGQKDLNSGTVRRLSRVLKSSTRVSRKRELSDRVNPPVLPKGGAGYRTSRSGLPSRWISSTPQAYRSVTEPLGTSITRMAFFVFGSCCLPPQTLRS